MTTYIIEIDESTLTELKAECAKLFADTLTGLFTSTSDSWESEEVAEAAKQAVDTKAHFLSAKLAVLLNAAKVKERADLAPVLSLVRKESVPSVLTPVQLTKEHAGLLVEVLDPTINEVFYGTLQPYAEGGAYWSYELPLQVDTEDGPMFLLPGDEITVLSK